MSMIVSTPKALGETRAQTFNFLSQLNSGETVVSAVTTCQVWSGVDPNPSAVILGPAVISNPTAYQRITGGVEGTIYLLTCTGYTNQGNSPVLQTYIPIVTNPL
jgi:hypothetical protein